MSLSWGLCQGACSPIPYFYSVFFIVVLIHRCGRDFERRVPSLTPCDLSVSRRVCVLFRCAIKYGKDWERYCSVVKYKFVPGIY